MRIVGIDLSLTSTGIAVIESPATGLPGRLTELHNVKSSKRSPRGAKDTFEQRQDRIYTVANSVCGYAAGMATCAQDEYALPDLVVIEAPSYGSSGGAAHDRSGLWWIVVNAFMNDGVKVAMVSPKGRAKYGTGNGNSDKKVVMAHALERYSELSPRRIANDDVADATLLAAMGARHAGVPIESLDPPQANLDAMAGVLWPTVAS